MIQIFSIIIAACFAPALLVKYIDKRDKYKHEPKAEIAKAFGYGVLVAFICAIVELCFAYVGMVNLNPTTFAGCIWTAFMGAAIPEETIKLLFLWLLIRRSKFFDENIDGIVYAVAISMGFAATENIVYLVDNLDSWQTTAFVRSLFSVPGHYMFAVTMGYYYSLAHFKGNPKDKYFTILIPVLFHGLYDSFIFMMRADGDTILLLLIFLLALMIYLMVRTTKAISAHLRRDLAEYIISITPPPYDENEEKKEDIQI